ncbi:unnamed protein product [Caenorhabditis nigoni]
MPSVDYEGNAKENAGPVPSEKTRQHVVPAPSTSTTGPKEQAQSQPRSHSEEEKMVTDRHVQVTSTTVHVLTDIDDKVQREQILPDHRRFQRDEARPKQEIRTEGIKLVDEQTRKFASEQTNLTRTSGLDMDAMERRQRKEIEHTAGSQERKLRNAQKKLCIEQEKEGYAGIQGASETRDEDIRAGVDDAVGGSKKEKKDFLIQLQQNAEAMLQRMAEKHKERMAPIEKQLLMQKQCLLRPEENNVRCDDLEVR